MRRILVSLPIALALATGAASLNAQGNANDKCLVTVDRSQDPGIFDVTRQLLSDGSCICYIYTGPDNQPESVEGQVSSIVIERSCPQAKTMSVSSPQGVTNTGFFGGPAAPLLALGGIGASAVAAANANENSPVVPVSP